MAASSPLPMYGINPVNDHVLSADTLPNPPCMYRMKNVHEDTANVEAAVEPAARQLLERQLAILKDLEKLKGEMDNISADIETSGDSCEQKTCIPAISTTASTTLAVKVSPNNPPFSLLLLLKMLQHHGFTCSTVAHTHSSLMEDIPDAVRNMFGNSFICDSKAHLRLRIIWKNQILAPSLMVSVANQSPILGEVNILRYICHSLMPPLYNKVDALRMANMDALLSAATTQSNNNGKSLIGSLDGQLGKQKWLAGCAPTLVDIYCSVAVLKLKCGKKLPSNVKKWLETCKKELPGFQDIENIIKSV